MSALMTKLGQNIETKSMRNLYTKLGLIQWLWKYYGYLDESIRMMQMLWKSSNNMVTKHLRALITSWPNKRLLEFNKLSEHYLLKVLAMNDLSFTVYMKIVFWVSVIDR